MNGAIGADLASGPPSRHSRQLDEQRALAALRERRPHGELQSVKEFITRIAEEQET